VKSNLSTPSLSKEKKKEVTCYGLHDQAQFFKRKKLKEKEVKN
jgi:hypothetical protein